MKPGEGLGYFGRANRPEAFNQAGGNSIMEYRGKRRFLQAFLSAINVELMKACYLGF